MEKVCFALNIDDDWPPVATESVWCSRSGDAYELLNAPFFIDGLAFGDKFTAKPDEVNGCIFEFEVVKESGHSLAWVINNEELDFTGWKQLLLEQGCSVEGLAAFRLHSIDVPAAVDAANINALVNRIEAAGFAMAFPVWRHEAEAP